MGRGSDGAPEVLQKYDLLPVMDLAIYQLLSFRYSPLFLPTIS